MRIIDAIDTLRGWTAAWIMDGFRAALTDGGDSRLLIGLATGTNRYLVPPVPVEGEVCFSSCTASPISDAGYRRAMCCYADLAMARTRDESAGRYAAWQSQVESSLAAYLRTDGLADILLLPSGTDGLLLCSVLLSLEAGGRPMTAILPVASETGSGVPRAATRQAFDGPCSFDRLAGAVEIPLRTPCGSVRPEDAVSEEFALAARTCAGRPVVYLTCGSKTGLVAPLHVPADAEVVVDACQLRLSSRHACARDGRSW